VFICQLLEPSDENTVMMELFVFICQLLESSDENTLSLLLSFLKDREAKRHSLILDLAQRGTQCSRFIAAVEMSNNILFFHSYINSPTLFRMAPSPTHYGLPFPKIWGSQPALKTVI